MIEMTRNIPAKRMDAAVRRVMLSAPMKIGEVVVLFSNQRFREQMWVDRGSEPWKARKPNAARNRGRNLLVDSGRLRRSVRITRTTSDEVTVGTDVPYARVHNDGFRGTVNVRAHTRKRYSKSKEKYTTRTGSERSRTVMTQSGSYDVSAHTRRINMPRRRFLGESAAQTRQITRVLAAEITRALK